ncbi:MAG: hypothetical protein QXK37_02200 [Candidatus Woesearchaeota archaeon]
MNKAEVTNEVFFYIMAMIVIGLLMFFGIKWIYGLIEYGSQINVGKFKHDIENEVERIKTCYMCTTKLTFSLPDEVRKICFVEKDNFKQFSGLCYGGTASAVPHPDYDPQMCFLWKSEDDRNVLIDPVDKITTHINLGPIKAGASDEGYICFNVTNGQFSIKLLGLGDKTQILRP